MPTNKIAEANKQFSSTIGKALDTLTLEHWKVLNHPVHGETIRLYALPGLTLKNTDGEKTLILSAFIITQIIDSPDKNKKRLNSREYIYQLSSTPEGKPLYEFHWHPEQIDRTTLEPKKLEPGENLPFPFPHIHVRITDKSFDNLNKKHIPSGRVAFEDVLLFLFTDCAIKPKKENWSNILQETRESFREAMSWR
jgi:hypothetical protein